MQTYEFFRNQGNTGRGTYFALSLAFHMIIVLIVLMASTAPAILKVGDDQIIHVFLTSMETEQNAHSWNTHSSEVFVNKKKREVETVKAAIEPVAYQSREREVFSNTTVEATHPRGAEAIYMTSVETVPKAQSGAVVSNPSPVKELSLAVPRYRENVPPAYPSLARMRGYEGMVLLSAEIFIDGGVGSLRIKKSSGYEVLDRSAMKAVKTWKFEPGTRWGKPVSMWVDVPVKFILKDTEAM